MEIEQLQLPYSNSNNPINDYEKSNKQNSAFTNNQLTINQEIINHQSSSELQNLKQPTKRRSNTSCTNKLCKLYEAPRPNQQIQEIDMSTLCETCAKQFKKESYCIYCKQIYFDNTDDGKQWIMCQECERWVHSTCADFNSRENPDAVFKCIKCRKIQNQSGRRTNVNRVGVQNKFQKKKTNEFLNTLGFYWELSAAEIAEDMQLIKACLN